MTISSLIDLALAIGLMVGLYFAVGTTVFLNQGPYPAAITGRYEFVKKSGLVKEVADKTFEYYTYVDGTDTDPANYGYKKYVDLLWNYFTVVVPSNADVSSNVAVASSSGTIPGFGPEVTSLTPEYGRYLYENYFGYKEDDLVHSFVPSVDGDFTSKPKAGKDEAEYHAALTTEMFSSSTGKGHYSDAVGQLTTQPTLLKYASDLSTYSYLALLPSFIASPLIIYFLIPIFVPNGRTIGKLIMGLMVVNENGKKARKGRIILRQTFITIIFLVMTIPFSGIGISIAAMLLGLGFMTRTMSRTSQALHDRMTHTLVVNKKDFEEIKDKVVYE
jgi:uncharacterized RDD family membrane protein YckC